MNALFITLFIETGDPAQRAFVELLQERVRSAKLEEKTLPTPKDVEKSDGVSLMKAGQGALMLDTFLAQLTSQGYGFTAAYTVGSKVTFVAESGQVHKSFLAELFEDLVKESGWSVRRYSNPKGIAFSANLPVNRQAQISRAAEKNKEIEVVRVTIA